MAEIEKGVKQMIPPFVQILMQRLFRRFDWAGYYYFPNNVALRLSDHPRSITLDVVYREIHSGHYHPLVSVQPGDIIIDIGAHVGAYSIWMAKQYPDAIIHAYEPNPQNFAFLLHNLRINGVENVVPHNVGLGNAPLEIVHDKKNTGASTTREGGTIPAQTLSEILGNRRTRILKIDVEGAEYGNVHAADLEKVDCLLAEIHPNPNRFDMLGIMETVPQHRIQLEGAFKRIVENTVIRPAPNLISFLFDIGDKYQPMKERSIQDYRD